MFKKGSETAAHYLNISNIGIAENLSKENIIIEDNAFGDAVQPITVYIPKNATVSANAFGQNITVANREYLLMEDFIGFTYNGIHSSKLKICRTSNGSRYDNNLTATMTDKTADVPGGNGQYYFGTTFKNRTFTVNYAFDSLTESDIRRIKQTFSGDGIHDLVFDEEPYKVWSAKVTGTASMKHLCFEENGKRIYKGEGSITFTCYYPFAHSPTKLWQWNLENGGKLEYMAGDGRFLINYDNNIYTNKAEWGNSDVVWTNSWINYYDNGLTVLGDKPTHFKLRAIRNITDHTKGTIYVYNFFYNTPNKILISFPEPVKFDTGIHEGQELVWDSKTGLVTFIDGDKETIIPYVGNGVHTLKPGDYGSHKFFGITYDVSPNAKSPTGKYFNGTALGLDNSL